MKSRKIRMFVLCIAVALFMSVNIPSSASSAETRIQTINYSYSSAEKTGVFRATYKKDGVTEKNVWCYLVKGKVQYKYTGFAENQYGWWYIKNGKVDFSKTDIIKGKVDSISGWWYVKGGKVQRIDTVAKNANGWWAVFDGKVNFDYTGIAKNDYGYWYCKNGMVDFKYTGLAWGSEYITYEDYDGEIYGYYSSRCMYCVNGKVDFNKTDVMKTTLDGESGWWNIKGGVVSFEDTVAKNANGWWAVFGGKVDFTYTGVASNEYGTWFIRNGKVDFSANGIVKDKNGNSYNAKNGRTFRGPTVQYINGKWRYIDYYGRFDTSYTGTASNDNGLWYVEKGIVVFAGTGLKKMSDGNWYNFKGSRLVPYAIAKNANGTWYVNYQGRVDFSFTGLAYCNDDDNEWYVKKGRIDTSLSGPVKYDDGWGETYILLDHGKLNTKSTVKKLNGDWVCFVGGYLDDDYTGAAKNESGIWYVKDGKVDFSYTGMYGPNSVKNGKFTTNYTNLYETYEDKYIRVFGESDNIPWRGDAQYSSQAEADSHMTEITIKAWDFVSGTSGEKYTRTFTIEVNKAVAPSLKKAFDEIYALPEKFPIHALGGNDGKYTSGQHGSGLAVDINPNENYEAYVNDDGSVTITCGSLYEPGVNPYSIATNGNVAKILNKYGFTQGDWGSKVDYMHWSYFGN